MSLHRICHQFLHATYTDKQLARQFNTLELLLAQEEVQRFVTWVSKKPPSYTDVSYQSKRRAGRG